MPPPASPACGSSRAKRHAAYDLLAPVYGWFTEGVDTADLQDAKALLNEIRDDMQGRVGADHTDGA